MKCNDHLGKGILLLHDDDPTANRCCRTEGQGLQGCPPWFGSAQHCRLQGLLETERAIDAFLSQLERPPRGRADCQFDGPHRLGDLTAL